MSYSIDFRRGDVPELRRLLRECLGKASKSDRSLRELVKRVVAYMTMGIDVSPLFPEVIMCSNTRDVVQKKLVYMFLAFYAHADRANEQMVLLVINTMHKDCKDVNPIVRGLALRALAALQAANLAEYVRPMILRGLEDSSAYVRKTAALAAAKLSHTHPSAVHDSKIIDSLYDMIRDVDSRVVACSVVALNEILEEEGGIATNKPLLLHLIRMLDDFNEWHKCMVLELITERYEADDEDEVFELLNLLDPMLRHANHAVVLAAAKVFYKVTEPFGVHLYHDISEQLRVPLLTFVTGSAPEVAYDCLRHVHLLAQRGPGLWEADYKQFFCRLTEPGYVKAVKMQILTLIASPHNMHPIIAELADMIAEVSEELGRQCVSSICAIACRLPGAVEHCFERLLLLLDRNSDTFNGFTVCAMRDLLRVYPMEAADVVPELARPLEEVEDAEGLAAAAWLLGEFGEQLPRAPYVLENMARDFGNLQTQTKLELLTAVVKLFFKRPPECFPALQTVLQAAEDSEEIDVQRRARFLYRLLRQGPDFASEVIGTAKKPIKAFIEDRDDGSLDQIFEEFNTLSVMYGMPASSFGQGQWRKDMGAEESESEEEEEEEEEEEGAGGVDEATHARAEAEAAEQFFLGRADAALEPPQFEKLWQSLPVSDVVEVDVGVPQDAASLEAALAEQNVFCIALGTIGDVVKVFCFGEGEGGHTLAELSVDTKSKIGTATLKGPDFEQLADCIAAGLE